MGSGLTVVFYHSQFVSQSHLDRHCPPGDVLTVDRSMLGRADAVVFHIPLLPHDDGLAAIARRPGQLWVAASLESEVNYPRLADPTFMRRFDLTMTYRLSADVTTAYFGPQILERLAAPVRPKRGDVPIVYFASNPRDRSGRNGYARELMRHIPVDCYGRCLRNRTLPRDTGRDTKLDVIASYAFTLAFENSICDDYVTEKLYDPLIAGSVPIYLGAPNVDRFVPAAGCLIDVSPGSRFARPADLAAHLRALLADREAYDGYFAFKAHGADNPSFLAMVETQKTHPYERLLSKVRARRSAVADAALDGARGGDLGG